MDQTFKTKSVTDFIDLYSSCQSLMRSNSNSSSPMGYPVGKWARNSTAQACNSLVLMTSCFMFHEKTREVLFNLGKEYYYDCEKKLESGM